MMNAIVISYIYLILIKNIYSTASPLSRIFGLSFTNNLSQSVLSTPSSEEKCSHKDELCLTEECIHISSKVLSKLDSSVDPCDNFYRFACGGWQSKNKHKINNEENLFFASNLNEMPATIDSVLEDMLKGTRRIGDYFYKTKSFSDMKTFYDSCMDVKRIQKDDYDPAIEVLKSLKEFYVGRPFEKDSWNFTRGIVELMKMNSAPFFVLSLDTNLKNSSKWIPVITLPKNYGLISDELILNTSGRKIPRNKFVKLKTLKKFLKKIMSDINNEAFYLEVLSKIQGRETLNIFLESLRLQQRSIDNTNSNTQYGKPNKYTSFFSRLIETDSVVRNTNDINDLPGEKNKEESKFYQEEEGNLSLYSNIFINKNKTLDISTNETNINTAPKVSTPVPITQNAPMSSPYSEDITGLIEALEFIKENSVSDNKTEDELIVSLDNSKFPDINITGIDPNDYKVLLQDAEEALNLLKVLGINPEMHRRDLYEAIQEEVDNTRLKDIEMMLYHHIFRNLFVFSDIGTKNSKNATKTKTSSDVLEEYLIREQSLAQIMNFITQLKSIEPTEQEKIMIMQEGRIFNLFTLKQLQEKYPAIDWTYLLNHLLKGPIKEEDEILIFHLNYMNKFYALLEKEEPWVVHYAALTLFTINTLKELVTIPDDTQREEFCLSVTKETMNLPLSHMYLKFLGDDALQKLRAEVLPMVEFLKESAKKVMSDSAILTEEDKKIAKLKIDKMRWEIGGLDAIYNISFVENFHTRIHIENQHFFYNVMNIYEVVNDLKYEMFGRKIEQADHIWGFTAQPYTINAFYIQTTNSIVIPHAFFNPPYFYKGAPAYFKYGAAGMAFAHEMMHAFDFTGKEFDPYGVRVSPFSSKMSEGITENVGCFNNMISKVFSTIEKVEGVDVVMSVDNNATINENLADVMGLKLAYKAYKDFVQPQNNNEPILPGLPYTRDQLFFIGFAQPYCAILPTIAKVVLMEVDEHLVHNIRVNSVLLNSPEFSEAFQCDERDRMKANNFFPTCTIF